MRQGNKYRERKKDTKKGIMKEKLRMKESRYMKRERKKTRSRLRAGEEIQR